MTDRRAAIPGPRVRPADNPFASHRIDTLPFRSADASPEELATKLVALGGRAEIVGPEGSGKTTLLEELARHLSGEVVLITPVGPRRDGWRTVAKRLPPRIGPRHTLLVDAAGRLGPTGLLMLRSRTRNGRLVVTRHRAGSLPILHHCRTTAGLLADLVRELAPRHAQSLEPGLASLFERHHGNLRVCFRELYDCFAEGERW